MKMVVRRLRLHLLPDRLAVCRLDPGAPLPDAAHLPEPARGGSFFSVTRTGEEVSIVCSEDSVVSGSRVERGWRCLRVVGPLQFSLTGVLAALAVPLAERGVNIFALSTFNTDYLLVKSDQLETAAAALREAGHEVAMNARASPGTSGPTGERGGCGPAGGPDGEIRG